MQLERMLRHPVQISAELWRHAWVQIAVVTAVSVATGFVLSRDVPLWVLLGGAGGVMFLALSFFKPEYCRSRLAGDPLGEHSRRADQVPRHPVAGQADGRHL
jgi:putative inorganic carbon (HCO3(-)) transporter